MTDSLRARIAAVLLEAIRHQAKAEWERRRDFTAVRTDYGRTLVGLDGIINVKQLADAVITEIEEIRHADKIPATQPVTTAI